MPAKSTKIILIIYVCVVVSLLLSLAMAVGEARIGWRAACANDANTLAGYVVSANEIVLIEQPHAQSDSMLTATSRICVLYR